jgi:hypothetical protein
MFIKMLIGANGPTFRVNEPRVNGSSANVSLGQYELLEINLILFKELLGILFEMLNRN